MAELMKQERPAELVREEVNPMSILQLAIEKGASIDQLDKLLAMQERFQAGEARKAFVAAMAEFKRETIVITRDKENVQYSKGDKKAMYTSIGNLVGTVTPYLSKHGLSAGWNLDQSNAIRVGCTITHALGHSETTWITVPLDTSGAKNPLQQLKSSITYARVVSFEMACGLSSVEGNLDDDGNGAGQAMEATEVDRHIGLIEGCRTVEALQKAFTEAYLAAQKMKDQDAMSKIMAAKGKRKKELQ